MYEKIIENIKSNLGENNELNKQYLSSQIEVYKDHPQSTEIIKEISRLMWDCLSEDEKNEFSEISDNETPIADILNDIYYDIDKGNYETPIKKLDEFMATFKPMFEDDDISEYHFFTNLLEELVFRNYIGLKKELRYIPDSQPLLDLYYIYGFLLLETGQYPKAEKYLKKAVKINPVSSGIILELAEIHKIHTRDFDEYFKLTCDALRYAYSPQDIARCYRNLGYYYIEKDHPDTALALFYYSMEYDLSPLAYREIKNIQSKNETQDLTANLCVELIESEKIPTGANPFILSLLDELSDEYRENKLYRQTLYYLEIKYNLNPDKKTLLEIESMKNKINY